MKEQSFSGGPSIVRAYVHEQKEHLEEKATNGTVWNHAWVTRQAEIPFERLKAEGLNPLSREYIIEKINLRRVQKDCLISFAGNQYSVPAEYIGKDVAVIAMDNMLCAYHDGKQIAVLSYQKKFMVVNPVHYQTLTVKQSFDIPNTLFDKGGIIDFPMKAADLSRYDEVIYEWLYLWTAKGKFGTVENEEHPGNLT